MRCTVYDLVMRIRFVNRRSKLQVLCKLKNFGSYLVIKLGISSVKSITYQLRWFILIIELKASNILVCFKYVRYMELDWCDIYYSINYYHINNKSQDLHIVSITLNPKRIVNPNIKCWLLLCIHEWDLINGQNLIRWAITCSDEGTHILKIEFIISF